MFYSVALPRRHKIETIPWEQFFRKVEKSGVADLISASEMSDDEKKYITRLLAGATTVYVLHSEVAGASVNVKSKIIHAFDPIIQIVQGMAHPIAFLMITGGCLLLMMGQRSKGISMVKWAAIGYILVQFVPGIMRILEETGGAINQP